MSHSGGAVRRRRNQTAVDVDGDGPNQYWSWDITWLKALAAGNRVYLYLIEEVFSSERVGYKVDLVESGDKAAELL
ncbi:hypothetical protein I5P66_21840 [Serratia ureilytica]|uniref:hypothetical protein n=1 Tax=Serratia ureilytica TaxID=300181 RepID=UPI0018D6531C|nr:hypothetical protein [Serratia ureilytica]MBH2660918.1 hypothetical protein [Serratia ureilytica]MBH2703170.1 hypothetical protein [Serratia ureilytica]MBH2736023.1 hypothetical protein [Serratia ureilytica]